MRSGYDYIALVTVSIGLASALMGFIVKFGLPSVSSTVIKCRGRADQMPMSDKDEDFYDDISLTWNVSQATIKISRRSCSITADITGYNAKDDETKTGVMRGRGIHVNGVVYMTYNCRLLATKEKWSGVLCIACPSVGNLYGHWLTEHAQKPGKFAMGKFDLERL